MIGSHTAWAVKVDNGYLGIYFFDHTVQPLPAQRGCTTALFKTRREARELERKCKHKYEGWCSHPEARTVKVKVLIKEESTKG